MENREGSGNLLLSTHQLQAVFIHSQEIVVYHLYRTLLLLFIGFLAVVHGFLSPDVSRSELGRCLRRHGVRNLNTLTP